MLAEENKMKFFIFFLIITNLLFPNTETDTIKIVISDIEIYGGIDEKSISTNINVINEDIFSVNGNNNFQDLLQSTGSLHYAGGTSRAKYFQLRGLGELSQFSGEGPPHFYVGYIIDNIDFSGIGIIGKLYDLEQIEIFKGPQSASYGPNSMAGLINLVSKKPDTKKAFNFNTSIYSNNGHTFNLSSSIPITKNLLTKITLSNDYTNGFIKNISDQTNIKYDANSKDEDLLKLQILYNDIISGTTFDYVYYNINFNNKYDVWAPDNNGFISYSDYQGLDNQKSKASSFKIKQSIDNIVFTSITTLSNNDIVYSYDGDWGNDTFWLQPPYNFNPNTEGWSWSFTDVTYRKRENRSQEFRIKIKSDFSILTTGLFASKINENDNRNGWLFAGYANNINSKFNINNYSVYAKISNFDDEKLMISATIRYDINKTYQNLSYEYYDYDNYPYDYYYFPQTGNYINNVRDNIIGGNININYKVDDYTYINSSYSRGYKTSGINQTQAPFLADSLKIYDTEFCRNIELGIKHIKSNYTIEFSTFYMQRDNPQLRLSYQVDPTDPTSFDFATFNAKNGYNYGFELNSNIIISKSLSLSSYFSYLKTYVSEFSYLGTFYGQRSLAHTPQKKYGFSLNQDLSKYIDNLNFKLSSNYVGSFYFEEQNNIKSDPYNLIDISLNYKIGNIQLSLWSKNLTDKKYAIRGYQFVLDPTYEVRDFQTFGDPISIGITLDYNL